jgi:DNA-binding CsgD family transcriptional regulator
MGEMSVSSTGPMAVPPVRVARPVSAPQPALAPAPPPVARPELEFVLDRITDGMIVIDERARVLHANRPARELLDRVRDANCASGELSFTHRHTQFAFERALAQSSPGLQGDAAVPRQFLVRDPSGSTVARASVEPLQRRRSGQAIISTHLVSLHRQPDVAEVSAGSLSALYGLTSSEARVAAAAIAARSVDDLASRLELSRNTVKTHLKSVFRKCEVCSFAQLAALVATGPRLR